MGDLLVIEITNEDPRFYSMVGPFLARRCIYRETGARFWDDDGKRWFVAFRGRTAVGVAALVRRRGENWDLCSAYVMPDFRGSGVYRLLVSQRLQAAARLGVKEVRAMATSEAARRLRSWGFDVCGQRGRYTRLWKVVG